MINCIKLPFAATRSAPTMTASTRQSLINAAAAESAIRVAGMLSCTSSKAVSLDPWRWLKKQTYEQWY